MSRKPGGEHFWIKNAAFTKLTGFERHCMDCGQVSKGATLKCPGSRPRPVDESKAGVL